jgi:hypothetical protein
MVFTGKNYILHKIKLAKKGIVKAKYTAKKIGMKVKHSSFILVRT